MKSKALVFVIPRLVIHFFLFIGATYLFTTTDLHISFELASIEF